MALTRMRQGASSAASERVWYSRALLDIPYIDCPGIAREPEEEEMLMTAADSDWRRYGKAALVKKYGARTLTAICRSKTSTGACSRGRCLIAAALFTRTSRRPHLLTTTSTIQSGTAGSARSAGNAIASPPAERIRWTVSSNGSGRRPTTATAVH